MNFENKTILITGAATGIGATTATLFAAQGANVYALDIKPLSYSDNNVTYIQCDVCDFEAMKTIIANITTTTGIDYVFANAGLHMIATIEHSEPEHIQRLMDVNIKGVIHTLKSVLPIMRKQKKGNIVLMGSDQCFIGKPESAIYGLTKGAIGQLTKSTAIDYAPYNIRVNCICPGTVDTPIASNAVKHIAQKTGQEMSEVLKQFHDAQPIKRLATTAEIAKTVAFLCSDDAAYMTGSLISIDGGMTAQ
jgi:NAD(P)-dependent dehydrogenase (short-subunit alcohol dehydrogenase family)